MGARGSALPVHDSNCVNIQEGGLCLFYELPWDLTDEIDCAETEAVGLLTSLSPSMPFGFPLNLSIASWQISLNHSSSGSTLTNKKRNLSSRILT